MQEAIVAEVKKLKACGFIHKEQYPDQLANVILVTKKTGKVRICLDFRNLNDARLKDDFHSQLSM